MEIQLLIFAVCLFLYALVAGRIARMPLSGSILFVALGWLIGPSNLDWLQSGAGTEELRVMAELTLALVLFSDASNADIKVVKRTFQIPERLLAIGLPLTILAGFGTAWLIFPDLGLLECVLLAVILAPTDAALGQNVISNRNVPADIREGLDVESGLNDGICVPVLSLFLALATEMTRDKGPLALGIELFAKQVGIGLAAGLGVTLACVWLIRLAGSEQRIPAVWRQVLALGIAFGAYATAQILGGSGFIASFSGGLLFGALNHSHKKAMLEAAEGTGNVMSMLTWALFGALVVGPYLAHCNWPSFAYAVLSLTVLRMVPVTLALTGLNIPFPRKLFIGWFGPRGLASVVFLVLFIEAELPGQAIVAETVVPTVVLSILFHGITANPLSRLFARPAESA